MKRGPWLAAAVSLIGLAGGAALADGTRGDWAHHSMMWGGWGWTGMILGPLMMIAVLAAAIAVAVLLVRWIAGGPAAKTAGRPGTTALDILSERFAKGEIDKEEFEERRRVLSQ